MAANGKSLARQGALDELRRLLDELPGTDVDTARRSGLDVKTVYIEESCPATPTDGGGR